MTDKRSMTFRLSAEAQQAISELAGRWHHASAGRAAEAALVGWERLLAAAGRTVAAKFSPAEWRLLADACVDWQGPGGAEPGPALGGRLEARLGHLAAAARLGLRPIEASSRAVNVARRIATLPLMEAHAALRACLWAAARPALLESCEWWRAECRDGSLLEMERPRRQQASQARRQARREKLQRDLAEAGSVAALARKMNLTFGACWQRCWRLGLVGQKKGESDG